MELHSINIGVANMSVSAGLQGYLSENANFMQRSIAAAMLLPANDPVRAYWWQVNLVLLQLRGLYDGYMAATHGFSIDSSPVLLFMINKRRNVSS